MESKVSGRLFTEKEQYVGITANINGSRHIMLFHVLRKESTTFNV